jgi:hypothetical protein
MVDTGLTIRTLSLSVPILQDYIRFALQSLT